MARAQASLTPQQKRELGHLLHQREEQLYEDVRLEMNKTAEFNESQVEVPDEGDASLRDLIGGLNLAEVGRELAELHHVEDALQRLNGNRYGTCARCGEPIPYERLKAHPAAERCTDCQAWYEKHHAGAAPGPKL